MLIKLQLIVLDRFPFSLGMDKTINSQSSATSDSKSTMNPMLVVQGQEFAVVG